LTLIKTLFKLKADDDSAMASVPISGELIGSYGYLALSLYSGVSMLIGSFLLISIYTASVTLSASRILHRRHYLNDLADWSLAREEGE
jgi:hypothetical protein